MEYRAVYAHKKDPDTHALIVVTSYERPLAKYRTFRSARGLAKYRLIQLTKTQRKVLIVAKAAKAPKGTKGKKDISDEELEELKALQELEELEAELDTAQPDTSEDEDESTVVDGTAEEDDSSDLSKLNVKDLRDKARAAGIKVQGLKKQDLIDALEAQTSTDTSEEAEEASEDITPTTSKKDKKKMKKDKKGKKNKDTPDTKDEPAPKKGKDKKAPPKESRSRTTDGKIGTAEIAAKAGVDARTLRMVLRKHKIEKDDETQRYEWDSFENKTVKKILSLLESGEAQKVKSEGLSKLKESQKAKKGDTPKEKKKSGKGKKDKA